MKLLAESGTIVRSTVLLSLLLMMSSLLGAQTVDYQALNPEPLRESAGGNAIDFRILVDAANLGGDEARIAELTFAPDYLSEPHTHQAIEIFYVLSGRFGHNVNGEEGILEAGDIGICRPGDTIIHSVEGDEEAVVLTIWLPGGAAAPFHSDN